MLIIKIISIKILASSLQPNLYASMVLSNGKTNILKFKTTFTHWLSLLSLILKVNQTEMAILARLNLTMMRELTYSWVDLW